MSKDKKFNKKSRQGVIPALSPVPCPLSSVFRWPYTLLISVLLHGVLFCYFSPLFKTSVPVAIRPHLSVQLLPAIHSPPPAPLEVAVSTQSQSVPQRTKQRNKQPLIQTPSVGPHTPSTPLVEGSPPSAVSSIVPAIDPAPIIKDEVERVDLFPIVKPAFAYHPRPEYPRLLREQGLEGTVWLRVTMNAKGEPMQILLVESSGYTALDESALKAVKYWRFVPAQRGRERIASTVEFPIRFALE